MSLANIYTSMIQPLSRDDQEILAESQAESKGFSGHFETLRCTLMGCVLRAMRLNKLAFTASELSITQEEADELCRYMLEVEQMHQCIITDNSTWPSPSGIEGFASNTFDIYITWLEIPEGIMVVTK